MVPEYNFGMMFGVDPTFKGVISRSLFSSSKEECYVCSCLELLNEGERSTWKIHFVCGFNDWKLESVDLFFDIFYSNIPKGMGPSRLRW